MISKSNHLFNYYKLLKNSQYITLFIIVTLYLVLQFKCSMQDFDNSTTLNLPEYNPLHDSNLKTFYANERNLKRLRENGEITNENEVICNLKDFNQYREDLHKAQLYHVLQAYRQREAERHDRLLIANAEGISRRDDIMHSDRQHMHEDVIARKRAHEEAHHKRMVELYELSLQRIKRVRWFYKVMYMSIEHQRAVSNMKIKEHLGIYQDLQRKHLIKLKKLFQFKKDRYNRQMRNLQKQREQKHSAVQFQSWQLRLNARIDNQRRIEMLLAEIGEEREEFIERHKARYQEKWNRIQEEIKERSHRNKLMKQRKQRKKSKSKSKKKKAAAMMKRMMVQPSFCDEYRDVFEGLLDSELCYAMNAAIQMEGHSPLTFTSDDPIYKAAQYILNYILNDLNIDLSDDLCAKSVLIARIDNFLCDATKYVNYVSVKMFYIYDIVIVTCASFYRKLCRLLDLRVKAIRCLRQPRRHRATKLIVARMSRSRALHALLAWAAMRFIRLWIYDPAAKDAPRLLVHSPPWWLARCRSRPNRLPP